MKLIQELTEEVTPIITEAVAGAPKKYFIEGVFLQADLKNRNGRVYPFDIMKNEVDRYIKESVNKNRALGELGHPSNPSINLDRVSHIIRELRCEGKNWIGKAEIVDTPMGITVKGLMDSGVSLGVSSRGIGSLVTVREGFNQVQKDFMLSTAGDIVSDPSAPDAWVNAIMEEADWVFNASTNSWMMAEQYQKGMKALSSKQLTEKKAKLFEDYLNSLSSKVKTY